MEDSAFPERKAIVADLGSLLALHNGQDVKALDLSSLNAFTDYFVIATVTSSTHMKGLMKRIKDLLAEHGVDIIGKHRGSEDDDWSLVDCGWCVVHLMSERARGFYEIEKLWFQATSIQIRTAGTPSA